LVPTEVPLITIEAPGMGTPFSSVILPFTACCAWTTAIAAKNSNADNSNFLIVPFWFKIEVKIYVIGYQTIYLPASYFAGNIIAYLNIRLWCL
jgi:hypothetical protein